MKKKILIKENYSSLNLYNEFKILNEEQLTKINAGIEWTVENCPSATLIGGTALVYYLSGGRSLTPDIDFMVDDIPNLKNKLENDDIIYRSLRWDKGVLGITVDEFNTDYLDSNVGNVELNRAILNSKKTAVISGEKVKIIPPELLAIMKIDLGRDKDLEDGFSLLTSGKLNKKIYLDYLNKLNNLQDKESLFNYVDLIK